MGSREIMNVGYRCAFGFIGVIGETEAYEKRAM